MVLVVPGGLLEIVGDYLLGNHGLVELYSETLSRPPGDFCERERERVSRCFRHVADRFNTNAQESGK